MEPASKRMSAKLLKTWWQRDGVEPPFQGYHPPFLSVDSAHLSSKNPPNFVLFIGAKMEPSCKTQSLSRFVSKNSLARGKYQGGNTVEAKANGLTKWWEIYRYSVRR